jgi:hypothetical protein
MLVRSNAINTSSFHNFINNGSGQVENSAAR